MTNTLDGKTFAQMIISGANNLYNNRDTVDDLNVFPVPDGDTGTNMSLTVTAMTKDLAEKQLTSLTKTADAMSFATLRGARGNSGVILSQFFRGIAKELKGEESCDAKDFARALTSGSNAAYKAVMKPTEGTILTVAREAANGAFLEATADGTLTEVLRAAVERGNKALARTPEQLPALKKAGVVDAGGQGWMFVLEGALYFLENGRCIERTDPVQPEQKPEKPEQQKQHAAQSASDTKDIKFGYCTEFIIEKKTAGESADALRNAISQKGDCMLVIDDDDIVKVHIHTNEPGYVLQQAIKLGELINIKIDNMKHQHRSLIEADGESAPEPERAATEAPQPAPEKPKKKKAAQKKPEELKEFGFVSVAAGKGFAAILKDLGIDKIIDGGQTMNPSTDDILKAVNRIRARIIYVFPNNKNIIMAAEQAAQLVEDKKVIVIPTRSVPECIASMMAFSARRTSAGNTETMTKAIKTVDSASVTYAVRDTEIDGIEIKKDDILGVHGSDIVAVGDDIADVLEQLTDKLITEDTEYITLYYGKDVKKADAEKAAARLEEKYSGDEIEISLKRGGQPVYYYVAGIE